MIERLFEEEGRLLGKVIDVVVIVVLVIVMLHPFIDVVTIKLNCCRFIKDESDFQKVKIDAVEPKFILPN